MVLRGSRISETHLPLRHRMPRYIGCFPVVDELEEAMVVAVGFGDLSGCRLEDGASHVGDGLSHV